MNSTDVRIGIIRIEGTNCEQEIFDTFRALDTNPEMVHLKQLIGNCSPSMGRDLDDYHMIVFPGGSSAGDYVRAGAIFAARIRNKLGPEIQNFIASGKPVLGIGNGFQVLLELGVLPSPDDAMIDKPQAALHTNESARFECRPTYLKHENHGKCLFTSQLPRGEMVLFPCAHAEGNLKFHIEEEEEMLRLLEENDQIVFRYVDPDGNYAGYPWNPNGSIDNIAGICNSEGNVLGLMPHPERVIFRYQHPDWTRDQDFNAPGDGRVIFTSALEHIVKHY
ncbi:MAG: phosphoribosylformylglycinamidine synthase subunit PurQ [Euryarchaeota archaeon]|nr:phosphoribosylformylglycinamidine synthase subunit PurQ [Euryarchaeota archaeon]